MVVFDNPGQSSGIDDLIKRVVALEGETFEIRDGSVYIDGTPAGGALPCRRRVDAPQGAHPGAA